MSALSVRKNKEAGSDWAAIMNSMSIASNLGLPPRTLAPAAELLSKLDI